MNKKTETFTVRDREEFYGYVFNQHFRMMAGLKASYYFARDHKVLPRRIRLNRYYADELRYLDRAVHEIQVEVERDQLIEQMDILYKEFGHKPFPRLVRESDDFGEKSA